MDMEVMGTETPVLQEESAKAGQNPLVQRLIRGDQKVFDEIVAQQQRRIARLVYRLLGWSDEVEDVVQEVFLKVLKNLTHFRGQSSLETWLTTITVNTCRSWRRKRLMRWDFLKRFQQRTSESLHVSPEPNPDSDMLRTVRRAVQKLPIRYREVIVLRYLEQLPTAQIAAILGLNLNTVNVRLNRARVQLKEKLADWMEDSGTGFRSQGSG
jgi:RNA polymerase sigma-70 factor, ECF subfamily